MTPRIVVCIECKQERVHYTKQTCQRCYKRKYYPTPPMICKNCKELKPYFACGFCEKCYDRIRMCGYIRKTRSEYLDMLGGRCVCDGKKWECWHAGECVVGDRGVLQGDHINGGGTEDRKRFYNNHRLFKYYLAHPEEAKKTLQVLCANCNMKKQQSKDETTRTYPQSAYNIY